MSSFHGRLPVCIVVFAFAVLPPCTTFATGDPRVPLTLAEAEDLALSAEAGTQALLARAGAMREHAVAAESLPDPSLRIGLANYPVSGGGFSTEGMSQARIGIRQTFPRGRAADGRASRARAAALGSRAEARAREVLVSVRKAWLDAYYSQQAWRLVNESRPFFEDLASVTRSMYSVGRKSQHDVLRAELELSRLDDRIIDLGRARAQARAALS
ncbi:MAG: TolC family protein, partial [Proteobacteria bacterium]|nr:TolC family protein [Pseudomonadota bacterium]